MRLGGLGARSAGLLGFEEGAHVGSQGEEIVEIAHGWAP
jgi:hypothetical protein